MDTYSHFPGIIHINLIAIGEDTGSVELAHNTHIPMMTSSRETFSALLAICAGNSPWPVNSPHKGQWGGALMFSLICVWINGWVNNRGWWFETPSCSLWRHGNATSRIRHSGVKVATRHVATTMLSWVCISDIQNSHIQYLISYLLSYPKEIYE